MTSVHSTVLEYASFRFFHSGHEVLRSSPSVGKTSVDASMSDKMCFHLLLFVSDSLFMA